MFTLCFLILTPIFILHTKELRLGEVSNLSKVNQVVSGKAKVKTQLWLHHFDLVKAITGRKMTEMTKHFCLWVLEKLWETREHLNFGFGV